MFNRGCLILSVFLALAGNVKPASAQGPALQVQVYDYAGLKPKALHEFVYRTQEILVHTGLSVEVVACQEDASACRGEVGSPAQVAVRVLAGEAKSMKNVRRPPLGQSFADASGGGLASVFLSRVQDAADEAGVPWTIVLSYAAAHEIGHLLLGKDAHTPAGLMRANWDRSDFQAMYQLCLHFSDEQTRQLASRYGAVHQTVARPETLLAARR